MTSANSAEPDQTPKNVASDQVLHCLLTEVSFKIWIKMKNITQQPWILNWTGQSIRMGHSIRHTLVKFDPSLSIIIEPVHKISNNVVCATSKASDQPAQTRSLIRAFASRLSILWCLATDRTSIIASKLKRKLHRLVWVYTCQNATLLDITCHGSIIVSLQCAMNLLCQRMKNNFDADLGAWQAVTGEIMNQIARSY